MDKFARAGEHLSNPSPQPDGVTVAQPGAIPELQRGYIVDGRFQIERLVASGGFGCVYKVRHILMNKILALKTLHPIIASDTTILRLRRESQAVAKLDHPNIVDASDFGLIDGVMPFLAMEFVDGPTLAQHLKKCGRLSWESALPIFIPVCSALAYAHDRGVIHRDLKPSNIILAKDDRDFSRWIPKVVDFGIAKLTFGEEAGGLTLTKTGELFGTPLYMSPEQCAGTEVDNRSDIYSLGCVLFEALTGAPPFAGNSALETMMRHATSDAPSLKQASLGLEFPEALEQVLAKMLAKDGRHRYQNFFDVANDLNLLLKGDFENVRVTTAVPNGNGIKPSTHTTDWRMVSAFLLVGIICGAIATALYYESVMVPKLITDTEASLKREENYLPPAVTMKVDEGFFRAEPNKARYQFLTEVKLGKLWWWNKQSNGQAAAAHIVSVPPDASIALDASNELMSSPYFWGRFRPTDLTGVILHRVELSDTDVGFSEVDAMDAALVNTTQQQKLRYLKVDRLNVRKRSFNTIGTVPNLSWLWLNKVTIVNSNKPQFGELVDGKQIAALPNLRNLDTLVLEHLRNVSETWKALEGSHLRRLKVTDIRLMPEEIDSISKMRSLEVLDVHGMGVDSEQKLAVVASLPKLKILGIDLDINYVRRHPSVYYFPNLEKLSINLKNKEDPKEAAKVIKEQFRLPSKFDWNKDLLMPCDSVDAWLSPLGMPDVADTK